MKPLRELLEDAFDLEEVAGAEHHHRGAALFLHPVSAPMIGAADFEERAVARSVGSIEYDRLEKSGQQRHAHRCDVLRKRVGDRDRLFVREKRVPFAANERVIHRLAETGSGDEVAHLILENIDLLAADVAHRHARQRCWNVVEAVETENLFDQIGFLVNVSAIGRHGDAEAVLRFLGAESEASKKLSSVSVVDDARRRFLQFCGSETQRLRLIFDRHDVDRRFGRATGRLDDQPGRQLHRFDGVVGIDAPLESIGRIGLDAEAPGGATDCGRIEPGALQEHIPSGLGDLGVEAADDSA